MTTPTPHSADALKRDDCQAEFEAWFAKWTDDDTHFYLIKRQAAIAAWQAAWNRRPTPAASPDLGELRKLLTLQIDCRLDDEVESKLATDCLALLDRLVRAEAELASVPQFSRSALLEFNEKYCLNKSDLVACAESAFYWFGKCYGLKGAAAGAVPEGWTVDRKPSGALVIEKRRDDQQLYIGCVVDKDDDEIPAAALWHLVNDLLAAAPPAQGLPAAPGTNPTTQEIRAVAAPPAAAPSEPTEYDDNAEWTRKLQREAEAEAAPSEAKPVAWGLLSIREPELTNDPVLADYWTRKGREVTPLFATPPAQDAGTGEAAHANAIEALSDLAEKAQANGNSDAWVSRKVLLVRSAFRSNQNEVSADIARTVRAHCNDLSDCAAILDEDGRFKNTATEIRVAVTELRRAIANSGRLE